GGGDASPNPGGQPWQPPLPAPRAVAVGTAAIGLQQPARCSGITPAARFQPPGAQRGHRKLRGLMGGADQHEAAVAPCIVHPKRNAASAGGAGEVIVEDRTGLLAPADAWALADAHQLLLLVIHAQHGPTPATKAP